MKLIKLAVAMLFLLAPGAFANVVISQVLFNPINSEIGGEVIELKNLANTPVDLSGWTIATKASKKDATLPSGTIIKPLSTLLIADKGWQEFKDNPDWKYADYEEALTLSNNAGFVSLVNGNRTVDSINWSNQEVKEGDVLIRTVNGSIKSSQANFFDGIPVFLSTTVLARVPIISVSKSVNLDPEGLLVLENKGTKAAFIEFIVDDFYSSQFPDFRIDKELIDIEGNSTIRVAPMSSYSTTIRINTPLDAKAGVYTSMLRIRVFDS